MRTIFLRSVDPERNRARWYVLQLQPRLFGGVDVVKRWGRLGTSGGSEQRRAFENIEAAEREVARLLRLRRQHDC